MSKSVVQGRERVRGGRCAVVAIGIGVALAAAPAAEAKGPAATGTVYGGSTSQKTAFAVTLSSDRRRLSRALFQVDVRCSNGIVIPYAAKAAFRRSAPRSSRTDVFGGQRLSRTGTFNFRGAATRARGGMTMKVLHRMQGTLRGARSSGTIKTTIALVDSRGTKRASCATGALRWTAVSAPGRVFAGVTNAGGPVVLELNRTRRMITAFRIGSFLSCTESGPQGLADDITDVAVAANGAFRDSAEDEERVDDVRRTTALSISGKASGTRASGIYRHRETDRNGAGKIVDSCDSGALRWSLRSSSR